MLGIFDATFAVVHDNELNDIRKDVQRILDNDLAEWENKWQPYTPRESFARFVSDKPVQVQQVFWGEFEYMESKVNAGRTAYSNAIHNGGSASEARLAYYGAAETHHNDLIEINNNLNVKYGLADRIEQMLFHNGKYIYRQP